MRGSLVIIFSVVVFCSASSQSNEKMYNISGTVKALVGKEIFVPKDIVVELDSPCKVLITCDIGFFEFKSLKKGIYDIEIRKFGYQTINTRILLESDTIIDRVLISCCGVNKDLAERDISKGCPSLLLIGGISPSFYSKQSEFEEKYSVRYYDFGCTHPDRKCIMEYNMRIFKYLDKKYGREWRAEVRNDVIGLISWSLGNDSF